MPLEFFKDAISLSGITGSKLKSEIIGAYYPFWWNITSGGKSKNYDYATAIVELDAATGEIYIEETQETLLGSAGHAMQLKYMDGNTHKLKIILVEKNSECYSHLKNVFKRRWPQVNIAEAESPLPANNSNIYLLNAGLDSALSTIGRLNLGNSLFFFDPLRSVPFETIEKVARQRITRYFQTGTELIVFVFTSDWFLGRDDFAGLPTSTDENNWSDNEKITVAEADALFGNVDWRNTVLNHNDITEREQAFIDSYKTSLHKWFRYVLPMPFNPKAKQIYHIILCSNFEIGIRATRGIFCQEANNPSYKPDNKNAYSNFQRIHSELCLGLKRNQKPTQWKMLWKTISGHEEGICDSQSRDFIEIEKIENLREKALEWLSSNGYLNKYSLDNPWKQPIVQYVLNWLTIQQNLGVNPPEPLQPLCLKPLSLGEINT